MGRIKYVTKNIVFGYIGNIIVIVLGFILRTVFIYKLGDTLLGVNGLYTGVLSILSLAELGIGTAMNYSLYAPVAEKNYEKIKSYMLLYKRAYLMIAGVVTLMGLLLAPFLKYIIKEPGELTIRQLTAYYLIFLFNTVSTYFVAYKYSLVNAEQKNYIQTNITAITKIVTVAVQVVILFATENFLLYLLSTSAVELLQKIFVSIYLDRLYPYLKEKDAKPLAKEEKRIIMNNIKALVYHKVGDAARLQTDNIIISTFINVTLVGLVSNYNLILLSASGFVDIIFNSALSSFGNLIATEGKEKQYKLFKVYNFLAAWIYGFAAIGFWVLLSPFIGLWLGSERVLGGLVITVIIIDYYFKGLRVVLYNFKTAAGIFEADKYLSLIQGAVNLVISITLVQKIGLIGIYVGTLISGLIANIVKPYYIYRISFQKKAMSYHKDVAGYIAVILIAAFVVYQIKIKVMIQVNVSSFAIMFVVITVVVNAIFILFYHRSEEFKYLIELVKQRIKRK